MPRTVRRVLLTLAVLALVPVLALGGLLAWTWQASASDLRGTVDFRNALPVPPIADSEVEDGVRVFDLTMQRGSTDFGTGTRTRRSGFNGDYLGPTLRAARGEQVRVDVTTRSASQHAALARHAPAGGDGRRAAPDGRARPDLVARPGRSTSRPRRSGTTRTRTARPPTTSTAGLAGHVPRRRRRHRRARPAARVRRRRRPADRAGQDVRRRRLGPTAAARSTRSGTLGDTLVVNGTVGAVLDVTHRAGAAAAAQRLQRAGLRLRLRRRPPVRPDRHRRRPAGAAPNGSDRVQLSPGERAEIVVEVEPGEQAALRSYPPTLGGDRPAAVLRR